MDDKMQQSLEEVKIARADGVERPELWAKMHDLAEAGYVPAINLFRSLLEDADWDWRLEGLQLLGFHYSFPLESEIVGKIREMLRNDPSDFCRDAAAHALASQLETGDHSAKWPDPDLLQAMQRDSDEHVRFAAFEALLYTAQVPPYIVLGKYEKLKADGIQPTLEQLHQVLREIKSP